ncbi:glutamate--tRNA ligase [bacterium]
MTVRVRFAPSPTGFLHIGGARTALYNWLFARHNNGKFILRIEDTDELRSSKESVGVILEGMRWLGLDWDEGPILKPDGTLESIGDHGPYFQLQRRDTYQRYIDKLLHEKKAYKCFCSQEELAERREQARKEGRPPKYDNRCRDLTQEEIEKYESSEKKPVIRFKNDEPGQTKFNDIVKGEVSFENNLLDDFVIVKSSGIPLYNFAVTIDDALMEITHVIRGDDHISNTPRQLMLYKALGFSLPIFAHIPMILGSDGGRLSKRHGAASVTAYRDQGFLHEALVNYLALLGWATEDSQQLFELDDLIKKFTLERCSSSASIFDPQKLLWMNGEYIRAKSIQDFTDIAIPWLQKTNLVPQKIDDKTKQYLQNVLALEQEKVKYLTDIPELVDFILLDEIEYDQKAIDKVLKKEGIKEILQDMLDSIKAMGEFTAENLEKLCREYSEQKNIKTGQVFHPLRVSTSGRTKGPSLFHYMEILGREKVLKRIEETLKLFF